MVQVKSITNNKQRYTVVFTTPNGDSFEHQVSQDLIVEYRLVEGKMVDDFAFLHFKNDLNLDYWTQKVISKIQRKSQTEFEVRTFLAANQVSMTDIEAIVKKCKRLKLIDDALYVKHYIDYHLHVKMVGPKRLEHELRVKGIDSTLISNELSQVPYELYQKHLTVQWEKMQTMDSKIPYQKRLEKAKIRWVELGYPYSMIATFLQHRVPTEDDFQNDEQNLLRDAQKIHTRLQKDGVTGYELERKLLTKLLSKGYAYSKIKEAIQGGINDES